MNTYLKVAIEAAKKSGKFLKAHLGRAKVLGYKGESVLNLLTDTDRGSEEVIGMLIKKEFPGHRILGEESVINNTSASALRECVNTHSRSARHSGYLWIIDPLDGTTNYAHGLPIFCVSIALQKDDEIILGVIYDPMRDELFYSQKGSGAYLNKKRIYVSKTSRLSSGLLVTGFAYNVRQVTDNNIDNFIKFLFKSRAVRRLGSAALDLAYVACGRFDGFWEIYLQPWDTAAGSLILERAGGRTTDFNGKPFNIFTSKQLLASNGKLHNQMRRVLSGA